jgi:hypothetical protein
MSEMYGVWLTAEGQAELSKENELYSWYFHVTSPKGYSTEPPKFAVKVAEFEQPAVPHALAVKNAVDELRAQKETVLAEAGKKTTELESKIQKLLCIEGPSA